MILPVKRIVLPLNGCIFFFQENTGNTDTAEQHSETNNNDANKDSLSDAKNIHVDELFEDSTSNVHTQSDTNELEDVNSQFLNTDSNHEDTMQPEIKVTHQNENNEHDTESGIDSQTRAETVKQEEHIKQESITEPQDEMRRERASDIDLGLDDGNDGDDSSNTEPVLGNTNNDEIDEVHIGTSDDKVEHTKDIPSLKDGNVNSALKEDNQNEDDHASHFETSEDITENGENLKPIIEQDQQDIGEQPGVVTEQDNVELPLENDYQGEERGQGVNQREITTNARTHEEKLNEDEEFHEVPSSKESEGTKLRGDTAKDSQGDETNVEAQGSEDGVVSREEIGSVDSSQRVEVRTNEDETQEELDSSAKTTIGRLKAALENEQSVRTESHANDENTDSRQDEPNAPFEDIPEDEQHQPQNGRRDQTNTPDQHTYKKLDEDARFEQLDSYIKGTLSEVMREFDKSDLIRELHQKADIRKDEMIRDKKDESETVEENMESRINKMESDFERPSRLAMKDGYEILSDIKSEPESSNSPGARGKPLKRSMSDSETASEEEGDPKSSEESALGSDDANTENTASSDVEEDKQGICSVVVY